MNHNQSISNVRRVRQRMVSLGMALLGLALYLALRQQTGLFGRLPAGMATILKTGSLAMFSASVFLLITTFDYARSAAVLRLDWFTPALKRMPAGHELERSLPGRWLRSLLPIGWKSNHSTKQRGQLRIQLRRLGLSWLASPVRRVVQAACLLAFVGLFFYVCWPYDARPSEATGDVDVWPSHYTENLAAKEMVPAELFLIIDPLVSVSTAIAARNWVWSLGSAGAILILCVLVPRGFCGYLCPLGTTIDLFDWAIARHFRRFRVRGDGWWVHIKYYLLAATLVSAGCGVLVSGYVAAIPVVTRGALFILDPIQSGMLRGWHLVPALNAGHFFSIALFFGVLSLGFLQPRFWCKYVCPSGAMFSLGNLFRVTERKVESTCINCNKCIEICPFDAIKPDFTTRTMDCTMCQSCGGVCPTHAIKFVERWNVVELKVENDPPTHETSLGRRGFLSLAVGGVAAVTGGAAAAAATRFGGAALEDADAFLPVRPPGSVPEQKFLEMCIRCGECFKVCPNNVLQPEAFQQGLEGLWTPMVKADWAGCESSCNGCGQVCPTGAIRALPLEEKRVARMGLAIVDEATCLPFAGREACDLCVQECNSAGYHAIEYTQVGVEVDNDGQPIDGTGYLAPVVLAESCVGCGLCQTRCYAINVKEKGLLDLSAIVVEAGEGKEDRIMEGSYLELRQREKESAAPNGSWSDSGSDSQNGTKDSAPDDTTADSAIEDGFFVPDDDDMDPFGLGDAEAVDDPFGLGTGSGTSPEESSPAAAESDLDDPFGLE